jgi:lipoprotein-releasing system permease protein
VSLNLKYLFAARYVRSPKSHSVINIISGVSIVAMAVPVAAIILLLSIFNGLERMALDNMKSIDADLLITPVSGTTFAIEQLSAERLSGVDGVAHLSYVLEQSALVEKGEYRSIVQVKGVDEAYTSVVPLARNLILGEFKTQDSQGDYLVAAHGVMQDVGSLRSTSIGEPLSLYAVNRTRFSTLLPVGGYTRRDLPVAGIYSIDEDNRSLLITSLGVAQSLFNYAGRASAIEVKGQEGVSLPSLASQLKSVAGEEFEVRTREQRNSIYRLMALEKWGVFFIAALILAIASLSIVGTLVMVIIDKRDDVATLRTMGMTTPPVRDIFLAEGHIMARWSMVIGVVVGVALALCQQYFGLVRLNAATLMVDAYPVRLNIVDVLFTVAIYMAISSVITRLTVRRMI